MELDHLFVFVSPGASSERAALHALDLVPTYARAHPGQGTANLCYAFDNAFLELLWVTSPEEAASAPVARTLLLERSRWRERAACPFGISYRTRGEDAPPTWDYRPAYLPQGAIRVATDSDDPDQPMMFEALGDAPTTWDEVRRGALQRAAHISTGRLIMHTPAPASPALSLIASAGVLALVEGAPAWRAQLLLERLDQAPLVIELPL